MWQTQQPPLVTKPITHTHARVLAARASMVCVMIVWLIEASKKFHERQPIGGVSARPLSKASATWVCTEKVKHKREKETVRGMTEARGSEKRGRAVIVACTKTAR